MTVRSFDDDIPHPTRAFETLLIVGTASVLSTLDLFVVNLAFSSLRASFPGATNQSLSWVLSAYSILFAAVLVPAGRLADTFGRRRVFRLGLVVFGIASAACSLAPSVAFLVVARAVKGIGAAMMVPTSLGLLLAAYPRDRHTQMVGIWSATGSVAAALGPVVGGALVRLDWRLIFVINVPLAALATWRSRSLADEPPTGARAPDLVGAAFLALGVGALVGMISYAPEWGFADARTITSAFVAAILLGAFVARSLRHERPALDLRMFRHRVFAAATFGMAAFYTGFAMMLLGGTLYLTTVWGWDTLRAGIAFSIGPATAVASAIVAGRLRASPRRLIAFGALCFVIASVWWSTTLLAYPHWVVGYLPGSMLFGAGAGVAQTGYLAGGVTTLPPRDFATGTAVLHTARQLGAAIGVALFVALSGRARVATDYASAWRAIGLLAVLAACTALVRIPERNSAPERS